MEKLKRTEIGKSLKKLFYSLLDEDVMKYEVGLYEDLIIKYFKEDIIAIDAGCGDGTYESEWRDEKFHPKLIVGIDINIESLKNNRLINLAVKSSVKEIPFAEGIFDVIICRSVIEHLPDPQETFKEFYRILKKNGRLIVKTQSIYNPLMFINHILPDSVELFLKRVLIKNTAYEGTYPTFYRCNSKKNFKRISKEAGFLEERFIQHTQGHGYWRFSILKYFFLAIENISLLKFLRFMRPHIVACYVKP